MKYLSRRANFKRAIEKGRLASCPSNYDSCKRDLSSDTNALRITIPTEKVLMMPVSSALSEIIATGSKYA
jgi:hypothetical protein